MTGADRRFPCDACGSEMRFDPASGDMVCDHCGKHTAIATPPAPAAIRELDFQAALLSALPLAETEAVRISHCPNCGADLRLTEAVHAGNCPFCATPFVAGTGELRQIKPRGLLPFALDEAAARRAMTDWLGRLWFAPGGLQAYARKGRRMQGVYVPYWTFDAATRSSYRGQRGTIYYVTQRVIRDGKATNVQVAKVRWTPVAGRVARFFDDVLVLAANTLPKGLTDGLEPWDLSDLRPYAPEWLSGFGAEGYQVDLRDGFAEARRRMDAQIARDVRFDIGGDQQRITSIDTDIRDVTFKHILLPVWVAAYKYRGQSFRFVVNGQTGRVQGERPYSTWKIALAVVAGLILAAIVGYVYAMNG
ncbi:hypothetical protein OCGS_0549 [Oceaniovalibus guishaninsula JLT2003]|uniref:RRN7-type domain-containing protein n=1 Tax=Oceaniovalibus guishaninsula JLT2003 TaxID=1231392 RepID=K2HRW2_9RHOB|nr:TFIIB-type zinc finger domain-containing protein [Oceaniovalibus guishaninsula]EKE45459.1 hypothetical protein OCGS_0549 [Oceaniovalibus guishaninsula JLT2003]